MDPPDLSRCIFQITGGAALRVSVQPRSGRTAMGPVVGDRLKIRLRAAPVGGKANRELERFLAKTLGTPAGNVRIHTGTSGRRKDVWITGITPGELLACLQTRLDR